jgi:hypothetical protein
VADLSREEFDAIESEAAVTGDHRRAAELMTMLASSGARTSALPRAEAFIRAGEQWLLADDPAAAARQFRQAIADGGPVEVDPRAHLSRALYQLGQSAEAQVLISQLRSEGITNPRTCDVLAELLLEQGDLQGALEWATVGVELILTNAEAGPEPYPGLANLLRIRYRIRNDLRLPEDEYDRMLGV